MNILNIFITNLRAYNEGELLGEWVELPLDEEALEEVINRISNDGEDELFITDYESDLGIKVDEYESIYELNDMVQEIEDGDTDIIAAILEAVDSNIQRAIDEADRYRLMTECETLEDYARELVDDGCYGSIPDSIINYIDFEALARDLSCDGCYETTFGVLEYVG